MEASQGLHQRLLQDISELQRKPYPNITLRAHDDNIREACLILTPDGWPPMHLSVTFGPNYPLRAPRITMQSSVEHPNVLYGGYICASILNTEDGYTPAYTLKGIAIQMLSFFGSETLEQDYGGHKSLAIYRDRSRELVRSDMFSCTKCGFNSKSLVEQAPTLPTHTTDAPQCATNRTLINDAPDDILLHICDNLDDEELLLFAQTWSRISRIMTAYNIIHLRELQCFCLKKSFKVSKLGVGVNVILNRRQGFLESEFDLLSLEAFECHQVRRSVQGVRFNHWLPLPLSEKHWNMVKGDANSRLTILRNAAGISQNTTGMVIQNASDVLFHFMNDVVVKLNKQADQALNNRASHHYYGMNLESSKSTLKHASEKAIESYFHLFHLLLCLAESDHQIVNTANQKITAFLNGATSKKDVPNLGHLLIALVISSVPVTADLLRRLVKEAVTRNVVWMLNSHPELAYLEPDETSWYRLNRTFEASKTSYRLLLFLNLFCRTIRPDPSRPLKALREELFTRHGDPPPGTAASFAETIKHYHAHVNSFPAFLAAIGLPVPGSSTFTDWLKQSVRNSMDNGYSQWAIRQEQALYLRLKKEPSVGRWDGLSQEQIVVGGGRDISFFPKLDGATKGPRGRGRGRGTGRGRGF